MYNTSVFVDLRVYFWGLRYLYRMQRFKSSRAEDCVDSTYKASFILQTSQTLTTPIKIKLIN